MNLNAESIRMVWAGSADGHELPDGTGWLLLVPTLLPPQPYARAISWSIKMFTDKWRGLPHGDERETLGRALDYLRKGRVRQTMTDSGAGIPAFQSTERVSTTGFSFPRSF